MINKIELFDKIFKYILYVEGGYSDHKNDKGGKTKYGIIEKVARDYDYTGDMRDITKDIAKEIFFKE